MSIPQLERSTDRLGFVDLSAKRAHFWFDASQTRCVRVRQVLIRWAYTLDGWAPQRFQVSEGSNGRLIAGRIVSLRGSINE